MIERELILPISNIFGLALPAAGSIHGEHRLETDANVNVRAYVDCTGHQNGLVLGQLKETFGINAAHCGHVALDFYFFDNDDFSATAEASQAKGHQGLSRIVVAGPGSLVAHGEPYRGMDELEPNAVVHAVAMNDFVARESTLTIDIQY